MWIAAACAALALAGAASGALTPGATDHGVTDAMIAAADGNEWLTYGRDYGEQRFSPLTQISDQNVASSASPGSPTSTPRAGRKRRR
jgi:alcohol dehydrogenase (cytochrome c)/quinohemoprotein ethanol dehydrogenase